MEGLQMTKASPHWSVLGTEPQLEKYYLRFRGDEIME